MLVVDYPINVPAAGTYVFDLLVSSREKRYATLHTNYVFGAGGTSLKIYLQTTLDDGVTWRDVICHVTGGIPSDKASSVSADVVAPAANEGTDGALPDDTMINGIFGRKWRVKIIIVGTYTTTTLKVHADFVDAIS